MRTGPSNQHLHALIAHLKKESHTHDTPLWHRLAEDLARPARQRRSVNISRIERYATKDDIVVVPGKVLGTGTLSQAVTVAAWQFSESAKTQIEKAKGKALTIIDLIKQNPKGQHVRIIG
ncbi:50S ribosomal protein L18e [Candidatus Woesearchaeota archaeon]|nr:50S ribosomal protein L18e [Candidatus Woesearchaeota archaeon]